MADKKQYGLLFPTKKPLSAPKVGNVFGNDDDSEEEDGTDWVKKALKAENEKNKLKKQTKLDMQKALKEDPTIFQYDEVYDEMERTKEEEKSTKKVERKAKYIDNLMKSADLRKKEQELRKDRMIQKEIEAEEALYSGKERFVTSSYKAKLEEMKKFEEEQKNQDRLESIGDVTKQKDMSGFYRHLFRQKVERNEADLGIASKSEIKETIPEKPKVKTNIEEDDPIVSDSDSENGSGKSEDEKSTKVIKTASTNRKRQYRKKAQEASESEPESDQEVEKSGANDSNKTNESSKQQSKATEPQPELESPSKKQKLDDSSVSENANKENKLESNESVVKASDSAPKEEKESKKDDIETKVEEVKAPKIEKVKINIWEKRTVGPKFEEALQRYLFRKQERYGS